MKNDWMLAADNPAPDLPNLFWLFASNSFRKIMIDLIAEKNRKALTRTN